MPALPPAPRRLPPFLAQSKADLHAKFVDLEWQQRNRLLQGTQHPADPSEPPSKWCRLAGETITARNRYLNVEPFAQNRIKLRVAAGMNDYINASPIQLGKRRYIATQGPKETSVNHFYRMLSAEVHSPAVIVMLTQTHEAGREKCFPYYPLSAADSPLLIPRDGDMDDGFQGLVELQSIEEDTASRSEVRRLRLKTVTADGQKQETEIHHILFSGWPDFLIPEGDDRTAVLELVRLSAALNRPRAAATTTLTNGSTTIAADLASIDPDNPRIIHCSAGVGRSGTFIALDYLLSLMYTGQLDDLPADQDPIAETVDALRRQRMMMVQGESQMNFLYEVMKEQMAGRIGVGTVDAGADSAT